MAEVISLLTDEEDEEDDGDEDPLAPRHVVTVPPAGTFFG